MPTIVERPGADEYDPGHKHYVSRVPDGDIRKILENHGKEFHSLLSRVPKEKEGFRYEPGKWSVRQVIGHVIDSERIFGYRALCIARGETKSLPGFEENDYAANAAGDWPVPELAEEFSSLRASHILMLRHLTPEAWRRVGTANGKPATVRGLAYVIAGHAMHHGAVLRERYLG